MVGISGDGQVQLLAVSVGSIDGIFVLLDEGTPKSCVFRLMLCYKAHRFIVFARIIEACRRKLKKLISIQSRSVGFVRTCRFEIHSVSPFIKI